MSDIRIIEAYVHNGRIAVLVELSAGSDFATRTDEFRTAMKDVAMHIAAASPVSVADLLEQPFVKEPALSVARLLANLSSSLRERIAVTRFVRWANDGTQPELPKPPRSPALLMRAQFRG